ncbi:hypothetical protein ACWT_2234 [Actinoplanes sp. SE50]|nr:hypothetical protein ACPL_2361 [Actinoplanes sp. SE50/110]ATO81649.1 hypothetical protein ACWT_2234 [Actinoplanes sp. SE50]SLL99057.1 hypothetical protein ACSP50_2285 [Actinoplanes sp. SE50/110]
MGNERRINVPCHTGGIVGERHCRAAHNEKIRHDASANKAVTQSGEGSFEFGAAHQTVAAHAASRSRADR